MEVSKYIVRHTESIRQGIQTLDNGGQGVIFVADEKENILGCVTDGDFRRYILQENNLSGSILKVVNRDFTKVTPETNREDVCSVFSSMHIDHLPVLEDGKLVDVYLRRNYSHYFKDALEVSKLNNPVVIMAGGKGTRLKPFSNILPKPLIPMGDHSMIEEIMDGYKRHGINNFFITVNFKKNLIKAYFEDKKNYNITFVEEEQFLGTAGSLKYLEDKFSTPFFVSNCDILIKSNYSEIFDFHIKGGYDLTLVGSMQHFEVPYGVCKIKKGGDLEEISEKPSFDFLVNTGMYILNPDTIKSIPEGEFFHITHLMEKLKNEGKRVGVFPVSEKSWIDVGEWNQFYSSINAFNSNEK